MFILAVFLLSFEPSSLPCLESGPGSQKDSGRESWIRFRTEGDDLVHLTLVEASPRNQILFVFSDLESFETGVGKRLRLGSPARWFHWGIDFGLFTSLARYGVWNFRNISCDATYGVFGLIHAEPAILLLRLGHDCSNLLQGAPEFSQPIRFSQYYVYSRLLYPVSLPASTPVFKSLKPYAGIGAYIYQYPESHHLPFDFGFEIEFKEFLFPEKTLRFGVDLSCNGMTRYAPTGSLFLGWGTSKDIDARRLPFSIGLVYQWGQDARGQYHDQERRLLGIKINLFY